MHYDVTSCVICRSNNVEYLEKGVTKILSHCPILSDLCKVIKENVGQNLVVIVL